MPDLSLPNWFPFFGGGDSAPSGEPGVFTPGHHPSPALLQQIIDNWNAAHPASPGESLDQPPPADIPPAPVAPTEPIAPAAVDTPAALPPVQYPTGLEGIWGPPPPQFPVVLASDSWEERFRRLYGRARATRKPRRVNRYALERDLAKVGRNILVRGGAAIAGAIGPIAAGIAGVLYPTATAPADIPGYLEEAARRRQQEAVGRGPGENFYEPSPATEGPPAQPTPFGQRVLEGISDRVYDRDWLRGELERNILEEITVSAQRIPQPPVSAPPRDPRPESNYPPSTVPPPRSSSPPPSSPTAPAPRGGRVVRRVVGAMQNPAARWAVMGLGVVGALRSRRGRSGGGSTRTASPIAPGATIGTLPATTAYPGFMPGAYTALGTRMGSSSSSSSCNCKTKKRGPQRKCLERAPVVFKSGRRRGKSAGSKCVRFAN